MVVMDKISKAFHFIPFKSTYKTSEIEKIFTKEIFKLHGFPKEIVLDRDAKFTSNFFERIVSGFGYLVEFQYILSSSNKWPNKKHESSD